MFFTISPTSQGLINVILLIKKICINSFITHELLLSYILLQYILKRNLPFVDSIWSVLSKLDPQYCSNLPYIMDNLVIFSKN